MKALTVFQLLLLAALTALIVKQSDAQTVCLNQACVDARAQTKAASAPAVTTAALTAPADPLSLTGKLTADLTKAVADATAATDIAAPMRLACWQTLLSLVPTIPALPAGSQGAAAGIFDAYELAAEKVEAIVVLADYQIPPEVNLRIQTACGPVLVRANDLLTKFNLRLVRLGGAVALLPK